jgi:cytochrome c553
MTKIVGLPVLAAVAFAGATLFTGAGAWAQGVAGAAPIAACPSLSRIEADPGLLDRARAILRALAQLHLAAVIPVVSSGYLVIKPDQNITERQSVMGKQMFRLLASALICLVGGGPVWAQSVADGKKLYATYCSSCHGDTGKGDGPAARSLPAKPADHTSGATMNKLSDKFLIDIIAKGGTAVGKSAFMPGWGGQLQEKQLRDIVAYVRSIANPPYKEPGK